MKLRNQRHTIYSLALIAAASVGMMSCNDKSDPVEEDETTNIVNVPNVAVTSFSLRSDSKVMSNLDSVFFSIDLNHGVIYNADSLPKGTPVDKLIPVIKYSDYITKALITMEGGITKTGESDYYASPSDTIDFSGKVTLTIATADDAMSKDYVIKVNVHKQNPDSLQWDQIAVTGLPSRLGSPKAQGTVDHSGMAVCLIEESDGSFTLAQSDDIYANIWTKQQVALSFMPDLGTFTSTSDAFYILDTTGELYTSADALAWTSTGEVWVALLGGYEDTVLGLETTSEGLFHAQYPAKNMTRKAAETDFPIKGCSNLAQHSNKWTLSPVGIICGGILATGDYTSATWGFDGREWVKLSDGGIPQITGAALVPYYAFRNLSSSIYPTEMKVWMLVGGMLSDGAFNRDLYISYNNGVNWRKADSNLNLPASIPATLYWDPMVALQKHSTNISDAWKIVESRCATRASWSVNGDDLTWECPYIYLTGGLDESGTLRNAIWRGAINRLRFAPIF